MILIKKSVYNKNDISFMFLVDENETVRVFKNTTFKDVLPLVDLKTTMSS